MKVNKVEGNPVFFTVIEPYILLVQVWQRDALSLDLANYLAEKLSIRYYLAEKPMYKGPL